MGRQCVILTSGPLSAAPPIPSNVSIIAADSGLDIAWQLRRAVDLVIGDLDSVNPEALAWATELGTEIQPYPRDKDQSDLELALDAAVARGAAQVVVIGQQGGRLDHLLVGLHLLAHDKYASMDVTAWLDGCRVAVVRTRTELYGEPGDIATLLAVRGDALGVSTEGLRFPLCDETLEMSSSRGLSNELVAPVAIVTIRTGVLLAIQPTKPSI